MKIAHLSDIHYSPKNLKWADKAMSAAVDRAISEAGDACVISGDSYDHQMGTHEPAFVAYVRQVARIADHMPVALLYGTNSHDRPGCLDVFREMPTEYPILVIDEPGVWVLDAELGNTGQWVENPNEWHPVETSSLVLCALPSLNKAHPDIMENGAQQYVADVMQRFRVATDQARAAGVPSVLTTHGTVVGCVTESKYAMVSPDHEFTTELLFSADADATMLGHIHAQQEWRNGGQTIAYPGSLARLVHGDHAPKGWLLWDIETGNAAYEFIESPTRQLLEIGFDGPPVITELEELADKATADDAVRVRWIVDQEYASTIDKNAIRELFAHCDSVKLEPTVLPIQSVRTPGISKALTLEGKLSVWLGTTGDEDALPEMETRLAALRTRNVEGIINQLIDK